MTKTAQQTVVRCISRKRGQIATLREGLEDLNDYFDLAEARVRDAGKPRLTHAEVKESLRLEVTGNMYLTQAARLCEKC